jgi:hydrogenase small subunit
VARPSSFDPSPIEALKALELRGLDRRAFMQVVTAAAAAIGLPASLVPQVAQAAAQKKRPSVVWLHFQECTGCTESLLRTANPDLANVILDVISLDYHETLFAAAGHQIEKALATAVEENAGKFVLIVEGAIPTKDNGIYCKIAGKTAVELVNEVASKAGAIIALGSCASFGGIPAAAPNPTGAQGAPAVLAGKTVVTLPGCPTNPYNLLGVVLQFIAFGTLPALDKKGRPMFAFGRVIHEDCPRRPHFDAGRFALAYGDEGHRNGYCLYKLGCKGPSTHANCSLLHFGDVAGAWPIGIGHPCVGCTEEAIAFRVPLHDTVGVDRPTPPDQYPPITAEHESRVSPLATGLGGAAVGALVGAAAVGAKRLAKEPPKDESKKEG